MGCFFYFILLNLLKSNDEKVREMAQKRKDIRYHLQHKVKGNFQNNEKFLVEDIHIDGLKLISNFSPLIGSKYAIQLTHKDIEKEMEFQVTHVKETGFNSVDDGNMPPGVLYSVGGKILTVDEEKKKFILSIIYNR
jgi:hypothetical protein